MTQSVSRLWLMLSWLVLAMPGAATAAGATGQRPDNVFSPHPDVGMVTAKELRDALSVNSDKLVIDARRPEEVRRTGAMAGAIPIPFFEIGIRYGADFVQHENHLKQFGVRRVDGRTLDFSGAKALVFFDRGVNDGAALRNIRTLLSLGYPPKKLYWYRGGWKDWEEQALTDD